jgi:LPS-assembly protein
MRRNNLPGRSQRENVLAAITTRFCWCITLYLLCHQQVVAQTLTKQFPPPVAVAAGAPASLRADFFSGQEADQTSIPRAEAVPPPPKGYPVHIAAREQGKSGAIWTLTGEVEIEYREYTVHADKVIYNEATGVVHADGHLHLAGGPDDEQIDADHGEMNVNDDTGHFYEVSGSIGVRRVPAVNSLLYTTSNPFVFTGREVIKNGPERYQILHGSMTSCRLPKPDWELLSSKINVVDGKATARNSWFTLLRVPALFLPYVTHPVNSDGRQSGFLIPIGSNSTTKGSIVGEEVYWVIGRSADLTVGAQYWSKQGFAPNAEFRYRGRGLDFLTVNFHALLDRRTPDQGGEDALLTGRYDFSANTRTVADIEYLSSYVYRLAFEENFTVATSSEVKSQAFLQHERSGIFESAYLGRYQSFESETAGDEIRILHLPSLQAEAVDHPLWGTPLLGGFNVSVDTLTRSEPLFHARNVERLDLHPHLALPISLGGWTIRPEIGARETFYSRSEILPSASPTSGNISPTEESATLNREDFEASVEVRPPVVERDFSAPWLEKLLGSDVRHTIEPDLEYRYVTGINNFNSVLRIDQIDVVSNTNELEYGLTQHLFVRNGRTHRCRDDEAQTATGICGGGPIDWLSWRIAQKFFYNSNFGGAVIEGQRNVLATTLDLTGAAFLYGPRSISPVISRLRVRPTGSAEVEWDLDYDPKAGRINSSDVFATYQRGDIRVSAGQFKLNALDVNSTPGPVTSPANVTAAITNYNQARLAVSYGNSAHAGFGVGISGGYDFVQEQLQFGTAQATYNWDCCGISVGYRRYSLGTVRNEGQVIYSVTLAGVATAGNLRRAEKIF